MSPIVISALLDLGADPPAPAAGSRVALVAPSDLAGLDDAALVGVTHALVIGSARDELLVRRQAAALADRGPVVAWRTLPHGPGAILVLANQAASVGLGAGQTVAFLDEVAGQTWSGAWTPSVANLTEPAPSLGQHLRSWTPGGDGFVVTLSGENPSVTPVGKGAVGGDPPPSRGPLYCGTPDLIPEAARAQLLAVSGCSEIVELAAMRVDVTARMGTDKAVEVVALPGGGVHLPPVRGTCPTCATTVFSDFCPFCHVRRTEQTVSRGAIA